MCMTNQSLFEKGNDVWSLLTGPELVPGNGQPWNAGSVFRTGCISISGPEKYALPVETSEPLARKLAAEAIDLPMG